MKRSISGKVDIPEASVPIVDSDALESREVHAFSLMFANGNTVLALLMSRFSEFSKFILLLD